MGLFVSKNLSMNYSLLLLLIFNTAVQSAVIPEIDSILTLVNAARVNPQLFVNIMQTALPNSGKWMVSVYGISFQTN